MPWPKNQQAAPLLLFGVRTKPTSPLTPRRKQLIPFEVQANDATDTKSSQVRAAPSRLRNSDCHTGPVDAIRVQLRPFV
jgi:hypothetical protein